MAIDLLKAIPKKEETDREQVPAEINSKVIARRAVLKGGSREEVTKLVGKTCSKDVSEIVVDAAFAWWKKQQKGCVVRYGHASKRLVNLSWINERYALLILPDSQSAIIKRRSSFPIRKSSMELELSGNVVLAGVRDDGSAIYKEAADAWYNDCHKHIFNAVEFTSKQIPANVMNLFQGFKCEPKAGDCSLITEHIKEIWCSGVEAWGDAMLNLIAFQVQNIGKQSRIIVALLSEEQQAGKGILIDEVFIPMYGEACGKTLNINDLVGNFNGVLRGKSVFVLDEALYKGDKKAAMAIKGIVGSRWIMINEKFIPHMRFPSAVNLWLLSNNEVPAFIEEKDQRYWTLKVSPARVGDSEYFDKLIAQCRGGGCQAFLHEMLHRNISGFVPQRDVPRDNVTHAAIVRGGRNAMDPRFWLEECQEEKGFGCKVDGKDRFYAWEVGGHMKSAQLLQCYRDWAKNIRAYGAYTVGVSDFWATLTKVGFVPRKLGTGNVRALPDCASFDAWGTCVPDADCASSVTCSASVVIAANDTVERLHGDTLKSESGDAGQAPMVVEIERWDEESTF